MLEAGEGEVGAQTDGIDLWELPAPGPDGVLLLQTAAQLLLLWTVPQSLPLLLHRSVPARSLRCIQIDRSIALCTTWVTHLAKKVKKKRGHGVFSVL